MEGLNDVASTIRTECRSIFLFQQCSAFLLSDDSELFHVSASIAGFIINATDWYQSSAYSMSLWDMDSET